MTTLPTFTLAVTMLPDGTDVQVDFQRDPERWTEVRDAILVGIERLQGMIAEQNGCPARPKSDAEQQQVRDWYGRHAYTIARARKMTSGEEGGA